ncbi:MAG TPA: ArsR family transcriptional regulator [Nitrospirae bacterium]|nr:ArsR family transcriptional regulator [Nitrospirota bacterium]
MTDTAFKFESDILSALAHPNRLRIVDSLRKGTKCNCELMPELGLEQSNLSRHVRVLIDAGIIKSWKEGVRVNYEVADKKIFKLVDDASAIAKRSLEQKLEALKAG